MKSKSKRIGRWKIGLSWAVIITFIVLLIVRESDVVVSKLYFIGWPIYSDYVYPKDIKKISFQSLDGTPLDGWFIHGKTPLATKRPALLYIHGNAGNLAAQYSQFEFLSDWGYDIFIFDFRGFGLSSGRPTREGLMKDTQAAFQELTVLAPKRRYGLVGFSMGAAYATLLASKDQRVSAAAILGCFTTFREIGAYTLGTWGFPHWTIPLISWLLVPNGLDPLKAAAGEKHPPALFVHGTADGNVPYEMGQQVDQVYQGPKELLIMPGYGHGDYFKGPLADRFHQALDRLFSEKGKTVMKESTKWGILLGITAVSVWIVILIPAIPQNQNYHHFADARIVWGIRNFWDVATNLPFFFISLAGFFTLGTQWKGGSFKNWKEMAPYAIFLTGVLLTGVGSSYYHLSPDNARLVWDRLPMTLIFMSLVSIVLMERTTVATGFWTLWPLLVMGPGSVLYWSWTEALGRGDLSPYGFIQFYPPIFIGLVLYLFPKPFPAVRDLLPIVIFYSLAKLFELFDEPIFQFTGFVSGHALKHLAAAASVYWILVLLSRRKTRRN